MTKWGSFIVELVHCESWNVTHKLHDVFKLVDIFMLMIRLSSKRGWAKILVQIKLAIMFPKSGYTGQICNLEICCDVRGFYHEVKDLCSI